MVPIDDVQGIKRAFDHFQTVLIESTKEDEKYAGEADELIAAVSRVNDTLENVENTDQFKSLFNDFGWDFFTTFMAIQAMTAEEEDFEEMFSDLDEEKLEEMLSDLDEEKLEGMFTK